nr:hypothetical protein [Tanacetum cinerariifolium]
CSSKGDFKIEKESQEVGEEKEVKNSWIEKIVQVRINDEEMFDIDVLNYEEMFAESIDIAEQAKEIVTDKDIIDDITLAKALMEIKSTKPKDDKRAGDELNQERSKKKKVENDKESEELKRCLEIISDNGDDVTIDATPLSIKTLIIEYKIYKEGKKSYFQIFKADGNSQMYLTFSKMLKNFDRDLEVLWRLVKDIFIKTKPVDDMDSFLLPTLKTMFEHHVKDNIWRNQQGLTKVKN